MHLAVKPSTALFNSQVGPEETNAMTLLGIKNREPSPKDLFSWNNEVHIKYQVAVGHRAFWQTNKYYGLLSLAQPYRNI